ncbi:MAG: S-layer homology domain-containing protein [Deltaproteobacteria bacterium]
MEKKLGKIKILLWSFLVVTGITLGVPLSASAAALGQADFAAAQGGTLTLTDNSSIAGNISITDNITIATNGGDYTLNTGEFKIFVAGNNVKLTIENHVTITGNGANGVVASNNNGEIVMNSGSAVTSTGNNGFAIYVGGNGKAMINGGTITAQGANTDIDVENPLGAAAITYGGGTLTIKGTSVVNANGANGMAVSVSHGSSLYIQDSPDINAAGTEGIGVAVGLGGAANITGGTIDATAAGVKGESEDGNAKAIVDISGGNICATGADAIGIWADKQTNLTLHGNAQILATGADAAGVRVAGVDGLPGASENIEASISGTVAITADGAGAKGLYVLATGQGGVVVCGNVTINTNEANSVAVDSYGFGTVNIEDNVHINAAGTDNIGVSAQHGGAVIIDAKGGTLNISAAKVGASVGVGGRIQADEGTMTAQTGFEIIAESELMAWARTNISSGFTLDTNGGTDVYMRGSAAYSDVSAAVYGTGIKAPCDIFVPTGTTFENIGLPDTIGTRTSMVEVTWSQGNYSGNNQDNSSKKYIIEGTVQNVNSMGNATIHNIKVGAVVTVGTPNYSDLAGFEWAKDAIMALRASRIMNGTSDTQFSPDGFIERADFAVVLCRAFKFPIEDKPSSFPDDINIWNFHNPEKVPYIEAAKGLFYTPDSTFYPDSKLTKEDITYCLVKALGLSANNQEMQAAMESAAIKYYKDWANVGNGYKEAVALATSRGFIIGDGNGHFNPNKELNRAEAAVLLYRALTFGGGAGSGMFSDVKPGDWYYEAVMNVTNRKMMNGYDDGTFRPDITMTNRALPYLVAKLLGKDITIQNYNPMADADVTDALPSDFVTNYNSIKDDFLNRQTIGYVFAHLCNLTIPTDNGVISAALAPFADRTDADANYAEELAAMVNQGYIKGIYDNNELRLYPKGYVTRAELAVFVVEALPTNGAAKNVAGQVFSDVAAADWFYDGVMNLYNRGIICGYEDGTFRPNEELGVGIAGLVYRHLSIDWTNYPTVNNAQVLEYFPNNTYASTRETAAYTILKILGVDVTNVNADAILDGCTDKAQISEACKKAMAYMISIGALKGDSDGKLNPGSTLTRAEFAVFYARALNGVDKSKMNDYKTTVDSVKGGN